jgi:hypothetical protein
METGDERHHGDGESDGGPREEDPLPQAKLIPRPEIGPILEAVEDPREHEDDTDGHANPRDETREMRFAHQTPCPHGARPDGRLTTKLSGPAQRGPLERLVRRQPPPTTAARR